MRSGRAGLAVPELVWRELEAKQAELIDAARAEGEAAARKLRALGVDTADVPARPVGAEGRTRRLWRQVDDAGGWSGSRAQRQRVGGSSRSG